MIPDESGRRLLLLRGADRWEIPHWDTDSDGPVVSVAAVNLTVRELVGLEVTTLRCLYCSSPEEENETRFFELENHRPQLTTDGAWIERADLGRIELAEPEHRPLLERCLDERRDEPGDLRVEWSYPGWFDAAVAWIGKQVDALGLEAGTIVQERTWSISTLLRVPTSDGDLFFKASPIVFASEPALTRELGRRHPNRVPDVVAVDRERRWTLMRDFGGSAIAREVAPLGEALRAYARMQIEWVDHAEDLLSLGCPDRTLDALEREIDRVLADTRAMLPGQPKGLSPSELGAVPALAERLRAACESFREYDVPATLEHGDLHAGNMRATSDGVLFFDWSDGCLSVPFFSLVPLLEFQPLGDPPDAAELLRDAYLEPWTALAPIERLREAFDVARFLGLFHQAVSYYRIVEHTEARARWEWETVFPSLVRTLLQRSS